MEAKFVTPPLIDSKWPLYAKGQGCAYRYVHRPGGIRPMTPISNRNDYIDLTEFLQTYGQT